ncbi:MAG: hypothetical protein C4547_00930 [Phycisphaerales bacterium]|nr:MAG: hypothetical protein C4547_00930 [Phycisphaerales bacterium]
MNEKRFLAVVVFAAASIVGIGGVIAWGQQVYPQTKRSWIEQITASAGARRREAYLALVEQRKAEVRELVVIVEQWSARADGLKFYKNDDPLYIAVQLLGEYRAVEAVPLLMQMKARVAHQGLADSGQRELVPPFDSFFAAKALVSIGAPVVQPILNQLESNESLSLLEVQVNGLILREILGIGLTTLVLEDRIASGVNETTKARLQSARGVAREYDRFWVFHEGVFISPDELGRSGRLEVSDEPGSEP